MQHCKTSVSQFLLVSATTPTVPIILFPFLSYRHTIPVLFPCRIFFLVYPVDGGCIFFQNTGTVRPILMVPGCNGNLPLAENFYTVPSIWSGQHKLSNETCLQRKNNFVPYGPITGRFCHTYTLVYMVSHSIRQ